MKPQNDNQILSTSQSNANQELPQQLYAAVALEPPYRSPSVPEQQPSCSDSRM
jgi:hypothetical protein